MQLVQVRRGVLLRCYRYWAYGSPLDRSTQAHILALLIYSPKMASERHGRG